MEKDNPEKNYFNELIYKPVIKEITNHVVEKLLNEFEDRQNAIDSSDFVDFLKNRNKKIDKTEEMLALKKSNISENNTFKRKLPAINKYLKDMVDYSNFIICEGIVKMDSKTMSSRRRNLEQMIVEHNMRLQRKYGFDISTYQDIDIDKVIKYLIDYPSIESGSITTKNNKGIIHLKFDKSLDDKDDIGHLFDFRTFVKPHLILLLINYMTIKLKTSSNLILSNIYISARQSYVYGNLVDRFFVVFEFDKIDDDGEVIHTPYLKFEFDKTKSKLKAVAKTPKSKKSKSTTHYGLKSREQLV